MSSESQRVEIAKECGFIVQTYNPACGMTVCVSGGQYVETKDYLAEKARADAAERDAAAVALTRDHDGMKLTAAGLITRCANLVEGTRDGAALGYGWALRDQLLVHLEELAARYYAGDAAVVDEFLQLYCLGCLARREAIEAGRVTRKGRA